MSLIKLRKQIDKIDKQVIKLLSRRKKIVMRLWTWKKEKNIPLHDPKREKQILTRVRRLARKSGLSARLIEKIFKRIIKSNK